MTYQEIIQKVGRSILKKIYYINNNENNYLDEDDIESIKPSFSAPLIGTVMLGLEAELKTTLPKNKKIYIEIVASYSSNSATKIYGPYYLKEDPTYNADTKTYTHQLYDAMLLSMVDYIPIQITQWPCKIKTFFNKLVETIGYENGVTELPNGELEMEEDVYEGIDFTYRDVLEDLGQANGILFYIDENTIKRVYFGESAVTINDDILKNTNISFGEHFGPINSIVLSRSADSDSIYLRDEESVSENGVIEYKISDNQLMNGNNRSEFLPALLNQLKGIEYDIFDVELTGYGGFTPLEKVNFITGNESYSSYVFNNEIEFTEGYDESIYTDMPEETKTDYKASSSTDKLETMIYRIADKQNKKIEDVIQDVNENSQQISQVIQTVDGISNEVSNAATYKRIAKSTNIITTLEDTANTNVLSYIMNINKEEQRVDAVLIEWEDQNGNNDHMIFQLFDTLRKVNDISDFITIKENEFFLTKRISNDGNVLIEPQIINLTPLNNSSNYSADNMVLFDGVNKISYTFFDSMISSAKPFDVTLEYIIKNEFTDKFAQKVEIGSYIEQHVDEISSSVIENIDDESFGTKIVQNKDSVKLAWNQIGQNIKIEASEDGKAKFNIYDKNDSLIMSLDQDGMQFYNYDKIGGIGVVAQGDDKYIAFNIPIDYNSSIANGFAWGVTNKTSGNFYPVLYIKDFQMGPEQSDIAGGQLILANCGLTIEGQNTLSLGNVTIKAQDPLTGDMSFIDKNTGDVLLSISPANQLFNTYNTLKILENISLYVNQSGQDIFKISNNSDNNVWMSSDGYLHCDQLNVGPNGIYSNGTIGAAGDISTQGYVTGHIIDLSDVESKKEITKYNKSAIDEIKNTDIYSFLYKQGNIKKKTVGAVIGNDYNCSDDIISEDGKHISLYSMISVAYKAIQEQEDKIEELKNEISNLKEFINENSNKK